MSFAETEPALVRCYGCDEKYVNLLDRQRCERCLTVPVCPECEGTHRIHSHNDLCPTCHYRAMYREEAGK